MPTIIAMLRGVNLGGHKLVKMEALRALCDSLQCRNTQTYVQSGNVVFSTKEKNLSKLTRRIEDGIEKSFGFRAAVIVRTPDEMRKAIAANPFAKRELHPSKVIVVFLADELTAETRNQLEAIKVGAEEVKAHAREIYIYYPDGMGKSKFPAAMERVLKKTGTARNWNSVTKLMEMAEKEEKGD